MIDFHTHILPGIDDGSRSMDETEILLRSEIEQGVATVIATPHFYADRVSISSFLLRRQEALAKTREMTDRWEEAPRLLMGAEVYYFPGMSQAKELSLLTIEHTALLLLEMPFAQWTEGIYREVRSLVQDRQLTVLLAHIERFYPFQRDKSYLRRILDLPVCLQVNAGSLGSWRRRHLVKSILALDKPTVLGSDCHSPDRRPVNLAQGLREAERSLGREAARRLEKTGEDLLFDHWRDKTDSAKAD